MIHVLRYRDMVDRTAICSPKNILFFLREMARSYLTLQSDMAM